MSIILGSCDMSLFDITKLYAMLNEDGVLHDFRIISTKDKTKDKQIVLSEASARAVFDILKLTPRPSNYPDFSGVSYKTGTSFKFKDAQAIGSFGKYTVGVSLSYPDNITDNYHNSGFKNAAPVLFDILRKLNSHDYVKKEIESVLFSDNAPVALKKANSSFGFKKNNSKLKIIFPENDSTITPDCNGNVFIKYDGEDGRVFVNYDNTQSENSYIHADSEGFYDVCIFDESGQSDCVNFRVKFN